MRPVKYGTIELEPLTNAPRKGGEDTVEILESLHYTKEQIRSLEKKRVIQAIWKD